MAEPRRSPFTTIGPAGENEEEKLKDPTIRFDLNLFDTTETSCPEFSFADLMKDALPPPDDKANSDDPFGDVDAAEAAKMAAIAKEFEEKYGPKPGTKKKKKHSYNRLEDLIDLGDGYDETDPFVDNSEAYDEVVPSCLTTRLGGFYINSGKLDFKEMSDDSLSEFQNKILKKKNKKKRVLIDSDSDEERTKVPQKNKLKDGTDREVKKRRKKHLGEGDQPFKKPKRPLNKDKLKIKKLSPSVTELLKQQSESTSTVNGTGSDVDVKSPPCENPENQIALSSRLDNIIDSVIAMNKDNDSDSQEMMEEDKKTVDPESIVKLPTGLPPNLEQILDRIKQAAKDSQIGKCKFFTDDVNQMLLDIELGTRQLPIGYRSNIYAHLAGFLPCAKDTLLKRAKKLRLGMQDDKLKDPLQKLQDAITRVMPGLQQKYETSCQIYAQTKAAQEENKDNKDKDDIKEGGKEEISTESDEEGKTNGEVKKKGNFGPRKKFEWNVEIRTLLCDIVKIKMGLYGLSKVRSQSPEDYIRLFLDREVRVLWPKGWIQTRMLYKESRSAHGPWTNSQKLKKSVLMTKPVGPITNVSSGSMIKPPTNSVTMVTTPSVVIGPSHAISSASLTMVLNSAPPKPTLGRVAETKVAASSRSSPTPQSKLVTARKSSPIPQNKQWTESRSSPTHQSKKVPTILDYAAEDNSKKFNTLPSFSTDKKTSPLLSPASKMSAAAVEKTFQHCISDLIRDALESHTVPTKPKIEMSKPPQIPKISISASAQDSFLAQFQKYAGFNSSKGQAQVQSHALNQPCNSSVQFQATSQEEALKMLANQAHGMKKVPTQGHSSVKRLSDQGQHIQVSSQNDMLKQLSNQRADLEHKQAAKSFKQQAAKNFEEEKHRTQLLQQSLAKQNIQIQKTAEARSLLHKQIGQPLQVIPQSRGDRNISISKSETSAAIQNMITGSSSHSQLQSYHTNTTGRGLTRTAAIVSESLGNRGLQSVAITSPSQGSHSQVVYRSNPQAAHSSRTSSELKLNLHAADSSISSKLAQDLSTSSREPFGSILQKFYCQADKSLGKPLASPSLPSPGLPSPGLPSPNLSLSMTESSLPQMKSMGIPAWSSLLGSTASTTVSSIGYTSQYGLPKPVPGYQNVKLTNLPRDHSSQSAALHMTSQVAPGGLQGSVGSLYPTPQGQLMVGKTSPVSKQTSPQSQGLYPPHSSPSRKFGTHFPESSPHGY
ncbi:hypothetical protein ScPMuIL_010744 [Solemya velum]